MDAKRDSDQPGSLWQGRSRGERQAGRQNRTKTARAERDYARSLQQIGEHVGRIIEGFGPMTLEIFPELKQLLDAYAAALKPWAAKTASRMIQEINERDRDSWRSLGNAISSQLLRDIQSAPVGGPMREILASQVELITSLPTQAAERVHEITLKGLEDSSRASEYAKEILRSGEVTKSRATLIARTETARTASTLTMVRAMHAGSEGYFWETSEDGDVRPSHREMQGKFVRWDDPPTTDGLVGHAGCTPNCRCWPRPQLPGMFRR
jgi:SPP1 gp7 family putative phage head morphogenesis protein